MFKQTCSNSKYFILIILTKLSDIEELNDLSRETTDSLADVWRIMRNLTDLVTNLNSSSQVTNFSKICILMPFLLFKYA